MYEEVKRKQKLEQNRRYYLKYPHKKKEERERRLIKNLIKQIELNPLILEKLETKLKYEIIRLETIKQKLNKSNQTPFINLTGSP